LKAINLVEVRKEKVNKIKTKTARTKRRKHLLSSRGKTIFQDARGRRFVEIFIIYTMRGMEGMKLFEPRRWGGCSGGS